jgi:type I restriction enzyme S subunit
MANVSSSNGLEKRPRLAFRNTDGSHFPCWRQTSLGCIIEPYSEKVYGEHDYEVLTSSREGLQRQEDHFGSKQRHDTDGYNIIPFGYCTYRNRSDDGKFAFNINTISEKAIVSKFYPVFRFTNANSTFMAEFLNSSPRVKKKLSVLAVGTSQVVLSFEALKAAKFDLPCKDEQDKIAAFLECLNTRIENQRTLVVALKKYKRGLLNKVFSNTDEKIYPTVYLSEVADFLQGLTYSPSDVANAGHLVLRSSNIQNGTLSFDDCVYVDKSIPESLQVKCADVIMCVRNGSKSLVGKTALIPIDMPKTTWGAFMMIVRSKLNDTYIFHYLNSQMFFSQVFKDTGTATINQITKGILNECRLPLPPVEERKKISKMLSTFDAKIYNAERTLYALMETRKALLQQLFI